MNDPLTRYRGKIRNDTIEPDTESRAGNGFVRRVLSPSMPNEHRMTALFSPLELRETAIPNRVVVSPMCQNCSVEY